MGRGRRSEIITVKIRNWARYQNRKDLKSMNFFRMQADIFSDAKFSSLTATGKLLWMYLITESCRQYSADKPTTTHGQCDINMTTTCSQCDLKAQWVRKSLQEMQGLRMLSILTRDESVPRVEESRVEERRVEERREKPVQAKPEPLHKLSVIWNENCGDLPKVKLCNSSRKKKCEIRYKEATGREGTSERYDYWIGIVQRISESDFCNGKNDRNWVATFDWLLQPETHLKVDEGKFDNRKGPTPPIGGGQMTFQQKKTANNTALFEKFGQEGED